MPVSEYRPEVRIERGANILAGDVLLPRLIVKQSALEHNIDRMARFCLDRGVSFAPHAKTTMAAGIIRRQSAAGAWGFTVATTVQAQTLRGIGVTRILIANQVVEPRAIAWLATEISKDDRFDVLILVDSLRGVSILNSTLETHRPERPVGVLVELGEKGGRAGCRTDEEAIAIADAVVASEHLLLVGVEGFDALYSDVRSFLQRLRSLVIQLARDGYFSHVAEVIVSAGSSGNFEAVAEVLTGWELDLPVRTLLRPGGYATYDVGLGYVRPLEIWSVVVSRPEQNLAIAGFGRRDVPSDAMLPVVEASAALGQIHSLVDRAQVVRLMDQHAFIELNNAKLEVGELVGCSIANEFRPAFATWRVLPLVDDDYRVLETLDVLY